MSSSKRATLRIGRRLLAPDRPAYLIAEAGVNHQGQKALALKMVDVAHRAGADAVKFQAFDPEALTTSRAPTAAYQRRATRDRSQLAMLRRLALAPDAFAEIAERCRRRGIDFLLTPFDEGNVRLCAALRVKAVKWSSGELTNVALLARAVKTGKPVLISTGMGSLEEIASAVRAARAAGGKRLALLHCVSTYPAPLESLNLRVIQTLAERFGLPVGFSDHTLGAWAAPLARAQGAVIIEKHFTLSRKLRGPDHAMSAEPDELADYVRAVRRAETALGRCEKRVGPAERQMARLARRSVVAAADIRSGERIRASDLALKRPATGIEPAAIRKVVGRLARRSIRAGEVIRWTLLK